MIELNSIARPFGMMIEERDLVFMQKRLIEAKKRFFFGGGIVQPDHSPNPFNRKRAQLLKKWWTVTLYRE